MDPINLVIGVLSIGFGLFTAYVRVVSPGKFGKLEAMKKQWGDTAGNAIHVIAYTVMPIVVGISFIAAGIMGVSFFSR